MNNAWKIFLNNDNESCGIIQQFAKKYIQYRKENIIDIINHNKIIIESIIDIGCSDLNQTESIAEIIGIKKYFGIDNNIFLIGVTSKNIAIGDACNIPVKSLKFDIASGIGLFNYVENPERVFYEMYRVSKKYCMFTYPKKNNLMSFIRKILGIQKLRELFLGLKENLNEVSEKQIKEFVYEYGFKILDLRVLKFNFWGFKLDNEFLVLAEKLDMDKNR